MSNNKQTAVEQFAEQVRNYQTPLNMAGVEFVLIHKDMINKFEQQAKAMHKKEVIDAYHINPLESKWKNIGEQYYNETFN